MIRCRPILGGPISTRPQSETAGQDPWPDSGSPQVENVFRDAKHGAALRHLPSGHPEINTAWMWGALLAAGLTGGSSRRAPTGHRRPRWTTRQRAARGHGVSGRWAWVTARRPTRVLDRHESAVIQRPGRSRWTTTGPTWTRLKHNTAAAISLVKMVSAPTSSKIITLAAEF
jgi:hypothetical protein